MSFTPSSPPPDCCCYDVRESSLNGRMKASVSSGALIAFPPHEVLLSLHGPACSPMWFPFPEPRSHCLLFMFSLLVKVGRVPEATGPLGLLSLPRNVHLTSHSSMGSRGTSVPGSQAVIAYLLPSHLLSICSLTQGVLPSTQREEPKPFP